MQDQADASSGRVLVFECAFQAGSLLPCPCPYLADSVGTEDLPLPLPQQCRYSFIISFNSLTGPRAPDRLFILADPADEGRGNAVRC